jgi:fructokinase
VRARAYLTLISFPFLALFSVLGGGIMQNKALFPLVRAKTLALLNGYMAHTHITDHIDAYIVESAFDRSDRVNKLTAGGVIGSLELARLAYAQSVTHQADQRFNEIP